MDQRAAGCEAIDDDLLICMARPAIPESPFLAGWGNAGAGYTGSL